jgi:Xaa-Pro aminopeptidase
MYLTGFTGSSAYLLITGKETIILSDFRYDTQIQAECPEIEAEIRTADSEMIDLVEKIVNRVKAKTCGIEGFSVSKALFDQLESKLACQLSATTGWIEDLRSVKDKLEIAAIRKSIRVNQRAFGVIRSQLTPLQTELQIAHNLEHQMRQFGATGCAFEPLVGVGPRSALPHGKPSTCRIEESPLLLVDWGAQVDHYASDLTRILVTAKITPKLEKIYNIVLQAQLAAIRKVRPGIMAKEVDHAARSVIDKAGYGKYFGHGLGHGFGLEIHERPFLSPIKEDRLEKHMVITIEPGIYVPGWGGIRIEDDILVTSDGHEILSDLPKQLNECVVTLD